MVKHRRRTFVTAALGVLVLGGLTPKLSAAELQLPNLHAVPPYELWLGPADGDLNGPFHALRFTVAGQNTGEYPLEVVGVPEDTTRSAALQCVAWVGRVCTQRADAGYFELHVQHGHWHLDNYAKYELRRLTSRGQPDFRSRGLAAGGQKVSFCLMDSERVRPIDYTDPTEYTSGDPFDVSGFYVSCSGAFQGISAGWADVYHGSLEGQQVLLDGVADGDYALVVTLNPVGRILESDYTDNVAFTAVRLGTAADGTRTLEVLSPL